MPIIGNDSSGGKKPTTPTSVSASAGNASATVSFTEPTYEGKTGTATYVATSNPGSVTGTNTVSPITVSSLSNGTAYTFTVVANTPYGVSSDTSSASNSVTPVAPPPPTTPPPTTPPPTTPPPTTPPPTTPPPTTPPPTTPPPVTWYCSGYEEEPGGSPRQYRYTSSTNDTFCSSTFATVCSTSGYPAYPTLPC
jgi:hypothetical protein